MYDSEGYGDLGLNGQQKDGARQGVKSKSSDRQHVTRVTARPGIAPTNVGPLWGAFPGRRWRALHSVSAVEI